ncbi:MAG TPA: site-specific integrase [Acidimicrobiia bacterium]|nr:site-specific integrase [Acidimicrobiia bacterium]
MAGSIRRRGRDSWQLRVYRGVDGHGRPRWVTTTVHGSRRYAEQRLAELVVEVGHARLRTGTVGDLLERWFAASSPRWAATTTAQTRSIIDCHLAPELGHLRVDKLTTADIDDFYSHLLRSGGRNGWPLGAGTVHRIHVVLHRALAQAVRWEWIWLNPATSASPPRVPPAEVHPPDPAQVADLLAFVRERSPALFVFLRLAVSTGARRSQLLALRWCDVDFDRGALSFTRAAVKGQHGVELRPTKTHRTYRVEIDHDTLAVVADYRAALEASAGLAGGQSFVFSSMPDGSRPWLPNWVTKQFIAARRQAGLDHFRLHDLRHFMATQMLAAGVPIATVSQRLSHARTSTTLNVYAHAVPGGDRAAAETLAGILSAAGTNRLRGPQQGSVTGPPETT